MGTMPPVPSVMYTVHRVVTTAQVKTVTGETFTSSSSVSSVLSAVRNEVDNVGITTVPTTGIPTAGCFNALDLSENSNIVFDISKNTSITGCQSKMHNLLASQSTSLSSSQKGVTSVNCQSKTTYSIPRELKNVIPTCVYLLPRIAVHMEIEATMQCPSQVMLAAALGCEELGISNKLLAQSTFGLWMASPLLEIQLKAHQRPFEVRASWTTLLEKYSNGNPTEKIYDEPMIVLKRNVFFPKKDEEKIKDYRILELLYEEAKHNVISGRYIMEPIHYLMLAGIQARIELGPFNAHCHTNGFFRENQSRFLPQHIAKHSSWSWLPISRKTSAEVKLLEQFKRVPQTASTRKLVRKYLEICWALPFYGAAFFHGQLEQSINGVMSLINHKDAEVTIAVNERGIFIIDPLEYTLLLGLRHTDLSWDFGKPSSFNDPECITCIFLQFDAMENGVEISKLVQIFSRQAPMIDALIYYFTENNKKLICENKAEKHQDCTYVGLSPIQTNGSNVFCNKLRRLTLATFDDEGRCIGQMGSLTISY